MRMTNGERDLRHSLLNDYRQGQAEISSSGVYRDIRSPWTYYQENYWRWFDGVPRESRILEVGCGPGSLLAWLRERGFSSSQGVDASPGDVEFANGHLGVGSVHCADAITFLSAHPRAYDVVVAKALLEHVPKSDLLTMVHVMAGSLREGGIALIDVPNMDWIAAPHERYMDLTHEIGFTRESLAALLRLGFADCDIEGSRIAQATGSQRALRPLLLWLIKRALYIVGEGANETLFASRSLIAVARLPRGG